MGRRPRSEACVHLWLRRLAMFLLSSVLFAWLLFNWHAALPMSIAMAWGTRDMYKYALRVTRKFHLRAEDMVTGKYNVGM